MMTLFPPTNPSLSIFSFLLIISSRELSRTTSSFLFYERRRKKTRPIKISLAIKKSRSSKAGEGQDHGESERGEGGREREEEEREGARKDFPCRHTSKASRDVTLPAHSPFISETFPSASPSSLASNTWIRGLVCRSASCYYCMEIWSSFRTCLGCPFVCLVFERFIRFFCRFSL